MLRASRNDPCPCGSGKKYRACHLRQDLEVARVERVLGPGAYAAAERGAGEAARRAPFWEADVAPFLGEFHETGEPGSVAMVTADGFILTTEVLSRRPIGAAARARAVLDAVMAAARKGGVLPERLHLRDGALAEALRPELERRGVEPVVQPLPGLDEALDASLEHLAQSSAEALASKPWRWAETEAPPEDLAEFHAAAAAFHRAAPWRALEDRDVLLLRFPGEDAPWAASVMGSGRIHYGLALYSHPADLADLLNSRGDGESVRGIREIALSFGYASAGELPKPMRREVATAGWEIAAEGAYPTLLGINIRGRRITSDLVCRTALACRAVAAFTAAEPATPWRDAATGVEVDWMPGEDEERAHPWPLPDTAHPVGPAGAAADPEAALRAGGDWDGFVGRQVDRLNRFLAWVDAQKPSRAARDRDLRIGEDWLRHLIRSHVPAESATEYDLRLFLYHYLAHDEPPTKPVAKYLTRLLSRLFGYFAEQEGIVYPWAAGVLRELDELADGAEDVRDVLEELADWLQMDILLRVQRPQAEVAGTRTGWSMVPDARAAQLRHELHRRWLMWHDEAVRGGIIHFPELREVLVGRQRQWENTPHPSAEGKTPKQLLMELDARLDEILS